jgi:hypothetical protein
VTGSENVAASSGVAIQQDVADDLSVDTPDILSNVLDSDGVAANPDPVPRNKNGNAAGVVKRVVTVTVRKNGIDVKKSISVGIGKTNGGIGIAKRVSGKR